MRGRGKNNDATAALRATAQVRARRDQEAQALNAQLANQGSAAPQPQSISNASPVLASQAANPDNGDYTRLLNALNRSIAIYNESVRNRFTLFGLINRQSPARASEISQIQADISRAPRDYNSLKQVINNNSAIVKTSHEIGSQASPFFSLVTFFKRIFTRSLLEKSLAETLRTEEARNNRI